MRKVLAVALWYLIVWANWTVFSLAGWPRDIDEWHVCKIWLCISGLATLAGFWLWLGDDNGRSGPNREVNP